MRTSNADGSAAVLAGSTPVARAKGPRVIVVAASAIAVKRADSLTKVRTRKRRTRQRARISYLDFRRERASVHYGSPSVHVADANGRLRPGTFRRRGPCFARAAPESC